MALTEEGIEQAQGGTHAGDGLLSLLAQAARTIDHMWRSAQADGQDGAAVALGEASYGVHRALIALQGDWPVTS